MMTDPICDAGYGTPGCGEFFRCQRPAGHTHRHQELTGDVLCTWGGGGSVAERLKPDARLIVCSRCGVLDHLASLDRGHLARMQDQGVCFFCSLFLERKAAYDAGDLFVTPDHRWVSHSDQVSGAFGGRPARLVCDNGTVFGPDTQTWDGGQIDEADQHLVPPNAHIDWQGRQFDGRMMV